MLRSTGSDGVGWLAVEGWLEVASEGSTMRMTGLCAWQCLPGLWLDLQVRTRAAEEEEARGVDLQSTHLYSEEEDRERCPWTLNSACAWNRGSQESGQQCQSRIRSEQRTSQMK